MYLKTAGKSKGRPGSGEDGSERLNVKQQRVGAPKRPSARFS